MNAKVPECPNCKDGGSVKLVSPGKVKVVFSPTPAKRENSMQVFRCDCGWTMARTARMTHPGIAGQPI